MAASPHISINRDVKLSTTATTLLASPMQLTLEVSQVLSNHVFSQLDPVCLSIHVSPFLSVANICRTIALLPKLDQAVRTVGTMKQGRTGTDSVSEVSHSIHYTVKSVVECLKLGFKVRDDGFNARCCGVFVALCESQHGEVEVLLLRTLTRGCSLRVLLLTL